MPGPKDLPLADSVAAAKMAAARQAKSNEPAPAEAPGAPHDASEERTALLGQIEHWKEVCAEYRTDAEKLRRWRRLRQRVAPDGSLRHFTLVAIKSAGQRILQNGNDNSSRDLGNARLLLKCEQPDLMAIDKISGFSCVRGWAWPRSGMERIEVHIDNAHIGNAFHGFVRPDVIRSHPELGSDVNLGFGFRLDAATLSTGTHVLKIIAVGENGQAESIGGKIEVVPRQQSQEASFGGGQTEVRDAHNHGDAEGSSRADETVEASIVIFARNQAEFLSRSLPVIASQKTSFKFEIIGFDTESEDGTPQVFRRHGARVVSVRRNEFHHVNTRLRSLKDARGKFVVFFVGDALPADEHWLEGLVRPLMDDPLVAAVYSRQLPAPGCVPWEARDIHGGCSVVREVKQVDWSQAAEVENYRKHQWKFISFSDVSACYRRALLETMPVLDGLPEVEDQYWCKCLLEGGFRVVLEPTSLVIHSHNHSMRELYQRQVRFGRCFATFMDVQPESARHLVLSALEETADDLFFIMRYQASWWRRFTWILQAPVMRLVRRYGLRQGFRRGAFERERADSHVLGRATRNADAVSAERSK